MLARAVLALAAAAVLALAAAPSASAKLTACGKATETADDFRTGAKIWVKGRYDCSGANEVFAAWSSVVRQGGFDANTAPRRTEIGGVTCKKRSRGARVTLKCRGNGAFVKARWRR